MQKIKAYKSESGLVTESKTEALKDERAFNRRKALEGFVDDTCWGGMCKKDVLNVLVDNGDRLKAILNAS